MYVAEFSCLSLSYPAKHSMAHRSHFRPRTELTDESKHSRSTLSLQSLILRWYSCIMFFGMVNDLLLRPCIQAGLEAACVFVLRTKRHCSATMICDECCATMHGPLPFKPLLRQGSPCARVWLVSWPCCCGAVLALLMSTGCAASQTLAF